MKMKTNDFLERQEREYVGPKVSLKRHNRECHRNDGKPHEFKEVNRTFMDWSHTFLVEMVCEMCGKKDFKSVR